MTQLVLHLYHGRNTPDEEMSDWGFHTDDIPIEAFGFTYNTLWIYRNGDREELTKHDDMVMWEGKYYGDFEIVNRS